MRSQCALRDSWLKTVLSLSTWTQPFPAWPNRPQSHVCFKPCPHTEKSGAHLSPHHTLHVLAFVISSSDQAIVVHNLIKVQLYFQRPGLQSFICYRSLCNWQLLLPDRRCPCNLYFRLHLTLSSSPVIFCAGLWTSWMYFRFSNFNEKSLPAQTTEYLISLIMVAVSLLSLYFTCQDGLCNLKVPVT